MTTTYSLEMGNTEVEDVQDVSGLTIGGEVVDTPRAGGTDEHTFRLPSKKLRSGHIIITRSLERSKKFTAFIQDTLNKSNADGAGQDISVLIRQGDKTARRINLSNARASRWSGPAPDTASSSPAPETVTLIFEDITVV